MLTGANEVNWYVIVWHVGLLLSDHLSYFTLSPWLVWLWVICICRLFL